MAQTILIREQDLTVEFRVMEDGTVELTRFAPGCASVSDSVIRESSRPAPIIELQVTGRSTRDLHGYKHNASSASIDLR